MKNSTHTDGEFRKKLEDYLPKEIPSELSWEHNSEPLLAGLAQAQKRKRRRRFAGLFFLFGTLSLIISFVIFWPSPQRLEDNSTQSPPFLDTQAIAGVRDSSHEVLRNFPFVEHNIDTRKKALVHSSQFYEQAKDTDVNLVDLSEKDQIPLTNPPSFGEGGVQAFSQKTFYSLSPKIPKPVWKDTLTSYPRLEPPSGKAQVQLILYGGINGLSMNSISLEGIPDLSPVEAHSLPAWQLGALVQVPVAKDFFLTSGVEFERLRYEIELEKEENALLFRPETVDTIFINSLSGDSTLVFTDSIPGIRTLLLRNSYSTYVAKIPIWAGYRFQFKKGRLDLHGGLALTVFRRTEGIPNAQVDRLVGDSRQWVQKGVALSLQGAIQYAYPLGGRMHLVGIAGIEKGVAGWEEPIGSYSLKLGLSKAIP